MNRPEYFVWHCSYSYFGDKSFLHQIHVVENGWREIAYGLFVTNGILKPKDKYSLIDDGRIYEGRGMNFNSVIDPSEKGAHSGRVMNAKSWSSCLMGIDKFTIKQFRSAAIITKLAINLVPEIKVIGHCNVPGTTKPCPNFSVKSLVRLVMTDNYTDKNIIAHLGDWINLI